MDGNHRTWKIEGRSCREEGRESKKENIERSLKFK